MRSVPRAMSYSLTLGRDRVECQVELEHVHARLAEEAERAPVGVLVDQRAAPRRAATPRSRRRASACRRAFSGEMCGSSPEPDEVTASTGTCVPERGRWRAVGRAPARATALRSSWLVGPEVGAPSCDGAVVPVSGGRRPRMEVPRVRRRPDRSAHEPTTLAVSLDERAVRAIRERDLRDARDGERVEDAGEHA